MSARPAPTVKPGFVPVKTQRAFEVICDQIRKELAERTLKVGDKLPPERELAAQFKVSRGALREALRSLEVAGIIHNVKGARGGAFVQAADAERVTQAMQDFIHLDRVSLDELTEARIALQEVIVRLACARASEADLSDLERVVDETRRAGDLRTRLRCAEEFYAGLARATKNRIFGVVVQSLSSILENFVQDPDHELLQESLFQSRLRLVRLLREKDCDGAVEEMRKHLERIHRHIRRGPAAASNALPSRRRAPRPA